MLIGIAHARGEERVYEGRRTANISSQMWNSFLSGECPPTWPVWFTYIRAVRLWFQGETRCNQAACVRVCMLLARLCMTKSWHVHLSTAPSGSRALQVNKFSLKLHRLAIFSPSQQKRPCWESECRSFSPTVFCWEEAEIILRSRVNRSLLQTPSVMCLDGVYGKAREDKLRTAYQKQIKYTPNSTQVFCYLATRYLLQELIWPISLSHSKINLIKKGLSK